MLITPNMSMFDVAVSAGGTVEGLFQILAANGKGITEIPHVGDDYIIPAGLLTDRATQKYLAGIGIGPGDKQKRIATADDPTLFVGISYWKVEVDFKVS